MKMPESTAAKVAMIFFDHIRTATVDLTEISVTFERENFAPGSQVRWTVQPLEEVLKPARFVMYMQPVFAMTAGMPSSGQIWPKILISCARVWGIQVESQLLRGGTFAYQYALDRFPDTVAAYESCRELFEKVGAPGINMLIAYGNGRGKGTNYSLAGLCTNDDVPAYMAQIFLNWIRTPRTGATYGATFLEACKNVFTAADYAQIRDIFIGRGHLRSADAPENLTFASNEWETNASEEQLGCCPDGQSCTKGNACELTHLWTACKVKSCKFKSCTKFHLRGVFGQVSRATAASELRAWAQAIKKTKLANATLEEIRDFSTWAREDGTEETAAADWYAPLKVFLAKRVPTKGQGKGKGNDPKPRPQYSKGSKVCHICGGQHLANDCPSREGASNQARNKAPTPCEHCGKLGHPPERCMQKFPEWRPRGPAEAYKKEFVCSHCKRRGHTADGCYDLHPEFKPIAMEQSAKAKARPKSDGRTKPPPPAKPKGATVGDFVAPKPKPKPKTTFIKDLEAELDQARAWAAEFTSSRKATRARHESGASGEA
jgi:hypothetical protein